MASGFLGAYGLGFRVAWGLGVQGFEFMASAWSSSSHGFRVALGLIRVSA